MNQLLVRIGSLVGMSQLRKRASSAARGRGSARSLRYGDFGSSKVRLALVIMVAVKVAGLVLIFDPLSAQAFDGAKAAFSLASASMLAGLIALVVLQYGTSVFVRTRLHLTVGAVTVATLLATVFAEDHYIAIFGAQRHLGLVFVIDMAVFYTAVALAYRTARDWAILGAATGIAGALAMTYGFVQFAGLDPIAWADYTRQRPPSTFGNSDKFGHFLGVTLTAAVGFAMVSTSKEMKGTRFVAVLYAAAALTAVGLIATRGALLGIVAVVPLLGVIYLRLARIHANSRVAVRLVGAALLTAIFGGALLMATPLGQRISGGLADSATQQRLFIASAATRAFVDRPITGYGPDSFGVIYPRYRPPDSVAAGSLVNQDSAHSWILQALATTGVLGTASLTALAAGSFVLLWRGISVTPTIAVPLLVGAVAYWVHGFVAIGSPSVDWMGWVAAGGAATFGRRPAPVPPRRVAVLVQVAVIGVALALAISAYSAFQASRELNTARAARQVGRLELAITAAERAVQLDSGRAEHWYVLGLARQDRKMLPIAAQAFRGATERAPHVSGYWSNLALTLTNLALSGDNSLGGKDAALAAARRAVDADPHFPAPYHVLALVENAFGDPSVALDASATAIRLYKGEPEYEAVAADAALRLQDAAAARSTLERIVEEKDAPVLRVALARISLKLNDPIAARAHLRRALELDPQYAPALELVKQLGT